MRRVAVLGGGLSGLATSFYLLQEAAARGVEIDLSLWEADPRCGGKISTMSVDGFRCETGPNGFLDNVPQTLDLINDLGIKDRLLRSSDAARRRFIFSDGILRPLPENPVAFLRSDLLTVGGRLRIVGEYFVPRKKSAPDDDETIASFIRRRLGEEALQKLIDPMTSGIYAGDPETMSMLSCFPRVVALERTYGGLIRGMLAKQKEAKSKGRKGPSGAGPGGTLMSFELGLQELIDALSKTLGERLHTSTPAHSISPAGEGCPGYRVNIGGEGEIRAEAVVVATPAYAAGGILSGMAAGAAEQLQGIPYSAVSVVHLGYDRSVMDHNLDGFGFLIPHREKMRVLGSLWSSSIFRNRAADGKVLLTNMVGGSRDSRTPLLQNDELTDIVKTELRKMMNQSAPQEFSQITRWEKAIPQYLVGHEHRLRSIEERMKSHPGLFLVGNAYRGIGVNDCVKAAARTAPEVLNYLALP